MSKSPVLAVAFVAVLALAGCGSTDAPTSSDDSPSATPAAKAISEAEYQALLKDSGRSVNKAFTSVRAASSRDGLQKRLEQSAGELEKLTDELGARPGSDAAAAMKGLTAAFASAAGKVESGGLCTGPAAVAQLTRSGAAGDLRQVDKGLAPKRQPFPALKLKNGFVLSRKGGTGPGILVIKNGNNREGVVKLVSKDKRMSIYVARKGSAQVAQIPDGNFDVYFASGVSWDGKRNTFTRNCGFTKFEDKMKFTSGGGQYTQFTITLNPVAGGNAPSRQIDPKDFPRG